MDISTEETVNEFLQIFPRIPMQTVIERKRENRLLKQNEKGKENPTQSLQVITM